MANVTININSNAVVRHTAQLERLHRSALPVAVRGALNSAAFDVKKTTMPTSARREFTQRKPNFFKATSKVEQAKGFSLNSMKATVGFVGSDQAVEDLQQQEKGGSIGGRTFIPMKAARVSGSWNKNVKAGARLGDFRGKIVDSEKAGPKNGRTAGNRFIKSAVFAGKGGWAIGNRTKNGNKFLFQIRSLKRVNGDMKVRSVPMYTVRKGRKVQPKATHFMENASNQSALKIERFFVEQAQKQINRLR